MTRWSTVSALGRLAAGGLVAMALLPGCSRGPAEPSASGHDATATDPGGATSSRSQADSHPALPFVENDYARALAEARQRNVPLFVELWAPW